VREAPVRLRYKRYPNLRRVMRKPAPEARNKILGVAVDAGSDGGEQRLDRPRLGPGFRVREATEAEADHWRQARTIFIKGRSEIDLTMNPALYIGVVTHGTK